MLIKIDARGCGKGKTTGTIDKQIKSAIYSGKKILLVVSSINLQKQYYQKYKNSGILVINSTQYKNTALEAVHSILNGHNFICICQQCFTQISFDNLIDYQSDFPSYTLIIDETIDDVVRKKSPIIKGKSVSFNWLEHFSLNFDDQILMDEELQKETKSDTKFFKLNSLDFTKSNLLGSTYMDLTNPNYTNYITPHNYNIMIGDTKCTRFHVHQVFNTDLLNAFDEIIICAAAYDTTEFYRILKNDGCEFEVINHFEKHNFPNIKFHIPVDENMVWSKRKLNNSDNWMIKFNEYASSIIGDETVLTLLAANDEKNYLSNAIRLSHNVHGINSAEMMACKNIILAAPLQYSSGEIAFAKEMLDATDIDLVHWRRAYKAYQCIMRCALRVAGNENEVVNIFLTEQSMFEALKDYFVIDESNIVYYDIWDKKKIAMTKSEKNKLYYDKKRVDKKPAKTAAERMKALRERKRLLKSLGE